MFPVLITLLSRLSIFKNYYYRYEHKITHVIIFRLVLFGSSGIFSKFKMLLFIFFFFIINHLSLIWQGGFYTTQQSCKTH